MSRHVEPTYLALMSLIGLRSNTVRRADSAFGTKADATSGFGLAGAIHGHFA
jgi:hypothetical protein